MFYGFFGPELDYQCYVCKKSGRDTKGVFQTQLDYPYSWTCVDCFITEVNAGRIVFALAGATNPTFDHPNVKQQSDTNMLECESCGAEFDHTQAGVVLCAEHVPTDEAMTCYDCGNSLVGRYNRCEGCASHDDCHNEDDCSSGQCSYCGEEGAYCASHTECQECGDHIGDALCSTHRLPMCADCGDTVDAQTIFCESHRPVVAMAASDFTINDEGGIELDDFEIRFS